MIFQKQTTSATLFQISSQNPTRQIFQFQSKNVDFTGGGSLQEKSGFKKNSGILPELQFYWTPYQRRWYVARKAEIDEIPSELKNKPRVGQTIVKFLSDQTYSLVPTSKL